MPDPVWQADLIVRDGLLLGLLGGIALYQLLAFTLTRHRNELWCGVYVGLAALLLVSHFGYGFLYLWPHTPALDQLTAFILPSLMAVAGMLLSISFLDLRQHHPRLLPCLYGYNGLLLALAAAPLACEQLALSGMASPLDIAMVLIVLSLVGQIALAADASRHDRSAIIYCSAWAVYLVAVLLSGVDLHGIGQDDRIYRAGLSLQSLLLALALMSRMVRISEQRRLRIDLASAQVDLLEQVGRSARGSLHAIRLLAGLPANAASSRHLQFIERIAQRLLRCLDSTGDEMTLLRGPIAVTAVEFELPALVREILGGVVPAAASMPKPMLYAVIDQRLPLRVIGDPQRLRRLLTGLLERSLDIAGANSVALRFCMVGDPVGQRASMIVSLGAPRAAELRDDSFRRLVQALGGDSGTRGSGELWLRLPLQRASRRQQPSISSLVRPRILLLHPHRAYRRALASVLCAQGCLVDGVGTGPQALERIEASQCGDQRYDWLLAQPGPGDWSAVHTLAEIHRRWPHSAIRVLELLERGRRTSTTAAERPLLCNDVLALLRPVPPAMLHRYPSLYSRSSAAGSLPGPLHGMRILVAAADRDLRGALAMILGEQGGRVEESDTGRELECHYRRIRRDDALQFDALILCGTVVLAAEIRSLCRFERRRGRAPLPLLVVADGAVDAGAEKTLRRAGAQDILKQPVTLAMLVDALTPIHSSRSQDA